MPEPLIKFNEGDGAGKALSASFLNNVIERLNAISRKVKTPVAEKEPLATVTCWAINNTSQDFDEFSILLPYRPGLDLTTSSDMLAFQDRPLLDVITPTATTDFPVIAIEPILKHGGIGKVAIGGVAVCKVHVTDAAHEYANPTIGDVTKMTSGATGQVRIVWKESGTGDKTAVVYLMQSTGGSVNEPRIVDHVHVVSTGAGWNCERVSLGDPPSWPPTIASPAVVYTGVYESENRKPRIIDSAGSCSHIIPLYRDIDGNYFIVFWKVDSFEDFEFPTAFTITEDPVTCEITATPTLTTKRFSLSVTPPGTQDTGITLTISDPP